MKNFIIITFYLFSTLTLLFSEQQDKVIAFFNTIEELIEREPYVNIAVLDVEDVDKPAHGMENSLIRRFGKFSSFNVVDRTNIDNAMKELKLQLSGAVRNENVVEIGNILGANYLIYKYKRSDSIVYRLIDVSSSKLINTFIYYTPSVTSEPTESKSEEAQLIKGEILSTLGIGFGGGGYEVQFPDGPASDVSFAINLTGSIGKQLNQWLALQLLLGYCFDFYQYYDENSNTTSLHSYYNQSMGNGGGLVIGVKNTIRFKERDLIILEIGFANTEVIYNNVYFGIGYGIKNKYDNGNWGVILSPTSRGLTIKAQYTWSID